MLLLLLLTVFVGNVEIPGAGVPRLGLLVAVFVDALPPDAAVVEDELLALRILLM